MRQKKTAMGPLDFDPRCFPLSAGVVFILLPGCLRLPSTFRILLISPRRTVVTALRPILLDKQYTICDQNAIVIVIPTAMLVQPAPARVKSLTSGTQRLQRDVIRLILSRMVTWRILAAGLCLAVLCLLAPRPSTGEPYLICDPYPKNGDQPTRFVIVAGKLKYSVRPQWLPDRSVRLKFDLSQLPDGEHTMHVTAIDDRNHGKSDSIRLTLVKTGTKVTLLTSPEKAEPPAPPENPQKGKVPPSRIPGGLLRPPEP